MKNIRGRKLLVWIISVLLAVSLVPATGLAEETVSLELSTADCTEIGTYLEEGLYLYDGEIPEGTTRVVFSDFKDSMEEDGAITSITATNQMLSGVYAAPLSELFAVTNSDIATDENIELDEEYEDYDFTDCYAYFIMDDNLDMSTFIIKAGAREVLLPEITYTASSGGKALAVADTLEKGYRYINYYGTAADVDLDVLTIPVGTESVDLTFSQNCLAYNYLGKGSDPVIADDRESDTFIGDMIEDASAGQTEYTLKTDKNKDGAFDYIQVQNVYSADWLSGGEALYALTFRYDLFNAYVNGQALSKIEKTEDGYTPYEGDNDAQAAVPGTEKVPVYTVTLPEGTETVDLEFDHEVLAFNYDFEGNWLSGSYADSQKGEVTARVPVDANKDGAADYIQVQDPYDENWNSPVRYVITFDGVTLDKTVSEEITAEEVLHNIAAKTAAAGTAAGSQAPWMTADMMAYEKAFPNSKNRLTQEQKTAMADVSIDGIASASSSSDAAKHIIALVSMGIDPSALTDAAGEPLDGMKKLEDLTFENGKVKEVPYFEYALPYVLMAYQQIDGTDIQQKALVSKALELQDAWMDTGWGIDGMTPMVSALAPYYDSDPAVKKALDQASEKMKEYGALKNAASDGLAAVAAAALGADSADYVKELLTFADSERSGFGNDFNDEQGFRGLIAASQGTAGKSYRIYDFSGQTLRPADSSKWNVKFHVIPEDAAVSVKDSGNTVQEQVIEGSNAYLLADGEYSYAVTKNGYNEKTGTLTVSEGQKILQNISLTKEKPSADSNTVDVTVQVLVHDGKTCENSVTYKNEPDQFTSLLKTETYKATLAKNEGTARDALVEALDDSGISYVEQSNGYFSSIGAFEEFGHGSKSGWLYMVNGSAGTSAMQNVTFSRNGTLTVFFTDDYSKDYGSENWGGSGDKDKKDDPADDPGDKGYYDDTVGHWAEEAIDAVTDRGWMNGVADRKFAPDTTLSRAMFVTMLYRLEDSPSQSAAQTALPEGASQEAASKFSDVEKDSWYEEAVAWAVANDIVKGTSETTFSPNANVTREQMAAFLSRYTESKDSPSQSAAQTALPNEESQGGLDRYLDKDQISDWALESMSWAVGQGLINGVTENQLQPKGTATRAQAATILIRFDERILQSN